MKRRSRKKISFTDHAKDKLLRELHRLGVTEETVTETIKSPDDLPYDAQTDRYIAVSWSYKIAVVYEKRDSDIPEITVIYSSMLENMVDRRRGSGRWI